VPGPAGAVVTGDVAGTVVPGAAVTGTLVTGTVGGTAAAASPKVNAWASTSSWLREVVNRTVTSTTPAVDTTGDSRRRVYPSLVARTTLPPPNHTYTGTVVGNRPTISSGVPPARGAARGDIESTRQMPSVSGAGAGVVVPGTATVVEVVGADVIGPAVGAVVGTDAVVPGAFVTGGVATGAVVPGAMVAGAVATGADVTGDAGADVTGPAAGAEVGAATGADVTGPATGAVVGAVIGPTGVEPTGGAVVEPGGSGAVGTVVVTPGPLMGEAGTVVVVMPGDGEVAGGGATRR
jgi:hypothetical protein